MILFSVQIKIRRQMMLLKLSLFSSKVATYLCRDDCKCQNFNEALKTPKRKRRTSNPVVSTEGKPFCLEMTNEASPSNAQTCAVTIESHYNCQERYNEMSQRLSEMEIRLQESLTKQTELLNTVLKLQEEKDASIK